MARKMLSLLNASCVAYILVSTDKSEETDSCSITCSLIFILFLDKLLKYKQY